MNTGNLTNLLRRVNLGGLNDECLIRVSQDVAKVNAVNINRTILCHVEAEIGVGFEGNLGLCNLGTLIKFLSDCDDSLSLKTTDTQLIMVKSDKSRFQVLLLQEDEVPTRPTTEVNSVDDVNAGPVHFKLDHGMYEQIKYYHDLTGVPELTFTLNKDSIKVSSDSIREKQFTIPKIASIETDSEDIEECSVSVEASPLMRVFGLILRGKEDVVDIYIGNNTPLTVLDGINFWVLAPIISRND